MDQTRSQIICHMMTSLDGKISFGTVQGKDPGLYPFMDYMDLYNLTHEKQKSTAWMCGRVTMDEFDAEEKESLESYRLQVAGFEFEDFIVKNELNNYAFGIDTKGLLRWNENFLHIGTEKIDANKFSLVMVVTKETPAEYLNYLKSKNISFIFGGETELDFQLIFQKTKQLFGVERLLLEGGGSINGSVIAADLIDEISLLLLPFVINNSEAPALFYQQLSAARIHSFKLTSLEKLDRDVVWLQYSRHENN